MSSPPPLLPTLVAAVLLVGCGPGQEPEGTSAGVEVRDSAGVRIVSFPATTSAPDTLPAAPLRRLGRQDDPDHLFSGITGLIALSDGRVAVAERDGTLRIFGGNGSLEVRAGGNGEGPGEFAYLAGLQRQRGDTLVAVDSRLRRLTRFTADGATVGLTDWVDAAPEMPEGAAQCFAPSAQALLPDARILAWGWGCVRGTGRPGMRAFRGELTVLGPGGESWSLGEHDLVEVRENPGADDPRRTFQRPWIAGRPTLAVRDSTVLLSLASEGYRLRAMSPGGSVVWELRDRTPEPQITPEVRDAVEAASPETLLPLREGAPWPERRPGWDGVVVAHDGSVWLRVLHLPELDEGELWAVYDPEAASRRRVLTPPGFRLMDVRDGVAWGVTRDALGVEDVVALRIGS